MTATVRAVVVALSNGRLLPGLLQFDSVYNHRLGVTVRRWLYERYCEKIMIYYSFIYNGNFGCERRPIKIKSRLLVVEKLLLEKRRTKSPINMHREKPIVRVWDRLEARRKHRGRRRQSKEYLNKNNISRTV